MGLYAAKDAVIVAAQLNIGNVAARLLLHMALECWDDESNPARMVPRRYFGRRESSAIALGFLAPHNGSEAAFRAVKRATKELVDKGAIKRVRRGGNGKTAEFDLQLSSTRAVSSLFRVLRESTESSARGGSEMSPKGSTEPASHGAAEQTPLNSTRSARPTSHQQSPDGCPSPVPRSGAVSR